MQNKKTIALSVIAGALLSYLLALTFLLYLCLGAREVSTSAILRMAAVYSMVLLPFAISVMMRQSPSLRLALAGSSSALLFMVFMVVLADDMITPGVCSVAVGVLLMFLCCFGVGICRGLPKA